MITAAVAGKFMFWLVAYIGAEILADMIRDHVRPGVF